MKDNENQKYIHPHDLEGQAEIPQILFATPITPESAEQVTEISNRLNDFLTGFSLYTAVIGTTERSFFVLFRVS